MAHGYHINVWKTGGGTLEVIGVVETREAAIDEVARGYSALSYHHTIFVADLKNGTHGVVAALVLDLSGEGESLARARAREAEDAAGLVTYGGGHR